MKNHPRRIRYFLATFAVLFAALWTSATPAQLIGLTPATPLISFNNTGTTVYTAGTGAFVVTGDPLSILFPPPRFVFDSSADGPKSVSLNIVVDNTGALVGGVPGDDLVIIGAVDTTGDGTFDADGVLLTGEIAAFGSQDSGGPTDSYDFALTVTGGLLAPSYAGMRIGITLSSESSN